MTLIQQLVPALPLLGPPQLARQSSATSTPLPPRRPQKRCTLSFGSFSCSMSSWYQWPLSIWGRLSQSRKNQSTIWGLWSYLMRLWTYFPWTCSFSRSSWTLPTASSQNLHILSLIAMRHTLTWARSACKCSRMMLPISRGILSRSLMNSWSTWQAEMSLCIISKMICQLCRETRRLTSLSTYSFLKWLS